MRPQLSGRRVVREKRRWLRNRTPERKARAHNHLLRGESGVLLFIGNYESTAP